MEGGRERRSARKRGNKHNRDKEALSLYSFPVFSRQDEEDHRTLKREQVDAEWMKRYDEHCYHGWLLSTLHLRCGH